MESRRSVDERRGGLLTKSRDGCFWSKTLQWVLAGTWQAVCVAAPEQVSPRQPTPCLGIYLGTLGPRTAVEPWPLSRDRDGGALT